MAIDILGHIFNYYRFTVTQILRKTIAYSTNMAWREVRIMWRG